MTARPGQQANLVERRFASKREARAYLGDIGSTKFDELLAAGHIASVAIGRRRLVERASLFAYAERLLAEGKQSRKH
jgi:hypothetical protein